MGSHVRFIGNAIGSFMVKNYMIPIGTRPHKMRMPEAFFIGTANDRRAVENNG
jgi:hypothetical protein